MVKYTIASRKQDICVRSCKMLRESPLAPEHGTISTNSCLYERLGARFDTFLQYVTKVLHDPLLSHLKRAVGTSGQNKRKLGAIFKTLSRYRPILGS